MGEYALPPLLPSLFRITLEGRRTRTRATRGEGQKICLSGARRFLRSPMRSISVADRVKWIPRRFTRWGEADGASARQTLAKTTTAGEP
jgi:hypothetical protein